MKDMELLEEYASRNSEQAFTTLVSRHIDMVYSVAQRHVGNHHQAQEITQAVFVILARKARSMRRGTILSGWLFQTARLTAANHVRTEIRRVHREQEAYMQSNLDEKGTDAWQRMAPVLDAAIADLGEKDRNAIVLRFVNGKDYKEVGTALGASEEAAQVRVSRAVEKLRKIFSKRGITLSTAVLSGAIAANSMQAAPAGLASSVAAATVAGTTLNASTLTLVKGTLKLMAWTKIKIATGLGVAALIAYQWQQSAGQARQLALVREQLQQEEQQAGAQQAAIDRLEKEKQAAVEEKNRFMVSATKLLAGQQAALAAATKPAANAASNGDGTNPPSTGLAKMMGDPLTKEYIHQAQLKEIKQLYAPLFKELKLSPEQVDRFCGLTGDMWLKGTEMAAGMAQGGSEKAAVIQTMADANKEVDQQLQSVLGDAGYARYKEFGQERPAYTAVKLLNDQLGASQLSDDQNSRLLQVIKAEPYNLTHGMAGEMDAAFFGSQEDIDKHFDQVAAANQRILQQAAGFLTPEQLNALGALQTNSINAQKIQGAALTQKH